MKKDNNNKIVFSNFKKKSCWKRLFRADNVMPLIFSLFFIGLGIHDIVFIDECLLGIMLLTSGRLLLLISVFCIVGSETDDPPCIYDQKFINRGK